MHDGWSDNRSARVGSVALHQTLLLSALRTLTVQSRSSTAGAPALEEGARHRPLGERPCKSILGYHCRAHDVGSSSADPELGSERRSRADPYSPLLLGGLPFVFTLAPGGNGRIGAVLLGPD